MVLSAFGLEEVRVLSTVSSWAGMSSDVFRMRLVWRLRKNEKGTSKASDRNDQVSRTLPLTASYEGSPQ